MTALAATTIHHTIAPPTLPVLGGFRSSNTQFSSARCPHFSGCGCSSQTSGSTNRQATLKDAEVRHVTLNPNKLATMLPGMALEKSFNPLEPLVPGQSLSFFQKLLLTPIDWYQRLTRRNDTATGPTFRMISNGCIFTKQDRHNHLSCSEYMATAIKFFGQKGFIGVLEGVFHGSKRIMACNPWNHHATDPQWAIVLPTEQAKLWQKTGVDISA